MQSSVEKVVRAVDVDTFIARAKEIVDKFENNPAFVLEAQMESRLLLRQLEMHLEAKGLKC
jgi:hypothetical protein